MKSSIPSTAWVRGKLRKLTYTELKKEVAPGSGVGLSTLWRVREAVSLNPGIDTVRRFMPYVEAVLARRAV